MATSALACQRGARPHMKFLAVHCLHPMERATSGINLHFGSMRNKADQTLSRERFGAVRTERPILADVLAQNGRRLTSNFCNWIQSMLTCIWPALGKVCEGKHC